ncbi:MAG: response regulator transcription factor [Myxococcota bacterium]
MTVRVLIADDQKLVREGLCRIVSRQPGLEVVGTADNGRDAVSETQRLRPDVCLFDIRMPEMDGIEATQYLSAKTAVVLITTFDLDEYVYRGLKAGAKGFLLKDAGPDLIAQAIRAAAQGDALIAPSVTARLLEAFADTRATTSSEPEKPLTEREEDVLRLLATGQTNAEIGDALHISLSTVKSHIARLMEKLDARNRVELAMWAYESKRLRT